MSGQIAQAIWVEGLAVIVGIYAILGHLVYEAWKQDRRRDGR